MPEAAVEKMPIHSSVCVFRHNRSRYSISSIRHEPRIPKLGACRGPIRSNVTTFSMASNFTTNPSIDRSTALNDIDIFECSNTHTKWGVTICAAQTRIAAILKLCLNCPPNACQTLSAKRKTDVFLASSRGLDLRRLRYSSIGRETFVLSTLKQFGKEAADIYDLETNRIVPRWLY
jgi:hypothetical protein